MGANADNSSLLNCPGAVSDILSASQVSSMSNHSCSGVGVQSLSQAHRRLSAISESTSSDRKWPHPAKRRPVCTGPEWALSLSRLSLRRVSVSPTVVTSEAGHQVTAEHRRSLSPLPCHKLFRIRRRGSPRSLRMSRQNPL